MDFTAVWVERDRQSLPIFAVGALTVTDKIPRFETKGSHGTEGRCLSGKFGGGSEAEGGRQR